MHESTSHPGRYFAGAAILVTAPRLILAFLAADGVAIAPPIRIALLSVSSVATAIAMTGGAAYLAQSITLAERKGALAALWIAALACSSALMAPVLVAGLMRSPLAGVLGSQGLRWAWAVCAVLAVDLVAAGAIRADAERRRGESERNEEHERAIAELIQQRDSARAGLDALRNAGAAASAPVEESAASPLACVCGRSGFASAQALSGHQRWCPVYRAAASALSAAPEPLTTASPGQVL
jgi:MFS family permease